MRRACLKIQSGPAAVGFGGGQGGEAGVSPQRAALAEPTPTNAKRRAAGPLLISRPAHHAVNRVQAEADCPGWGLGKTQGESLQAVKLPRLVGFRGIRNLLCHRFVEAIWQYQEPPLHKFNAILKCDS
jgi:hypothetical protein